MAPSSAWLPAAQGGHRKSVLESPQKTSLEASDGRAELLQPKGGHARANQCGAAALIQCRRYQLLLQLSFAVAQGWHGTVQTLTARVPEAQPRGS